MKDVIKSLFPSMHRRYLIVRGYLRYRFIAAILGIKRHGIPYTGKVRFSPCSVFPEEVASLIFVLNRFRIVPSNYCGSDTIDFFVPSATYGTPKCKYSINSRWTDRSKSKLDTCHGEVFGYSPRIDAGAYVGPAVVKSEINGANDGELVNLPSAPHPRPGCVYQRLLNNSDSKGYYEDICVPVIFGRISWSRIEMKDASQQFSGRVRAKVSFRRAGAIFSQTELMQLIELSHRIGMDCGEFDVLRDRTNGHIYVIDANELFWFARQPEFAPIESWKVLIDLADDLLAGLTYRRNAPTS